MPDITVQPTAKFIKAGALLVAAAVVGHVILYVAREKASPPAWVIWLPALLMVLPAAYWVRRRFTKLVIAGDRLRYETGMASRSTRTIQLSKIQDVRVGQRISQRLFDVGDLAIETAGEASRLTLHNMDRPQALADEIMDRAQKGTGSI
ncbi:MAG: PH domain-containing protein [Bryobacteraceae bacterium]|jgi:uncharacterized membrane protein YdbT with pleckstrin-like domain